MSPPVAPSAPKRRWLSCFTASHEGAPGKAGCLMVFAAGSSNFNGLYSPAARDRARSFHVGHVDQVSSYHKVGGTEMLTRFNGWWLFNQSGSGTSYYGARAERAMPLPEGGWHAKQGLNPAPRVQVFDSYEEVPAPLRVPGSLELHALEVFGAGSDDCNGIYQICGIRLGRACYRRECGLQTILWHRGWWLLNENGSGESRYGFRCPESPALMPEDSIWAHKLGQSPAPGVAAVGTRFSKVDKAVAVEVSVEPVGDSAADAHTEQFEENPFQEDNSLDHPEPTSEPNSCASWLHAGSRETALRDASWRDANLRAADLCEAGLHEALQCQVQKPLSEGCSTSDSRTPSEVPEANPEFGNAEIDFEELVPTHNVGVRRPQALKGQEIDDPVPDAADAMFATTMPDSLGAVLEIPESVLPTTPLALEACIQPTDVLADEASKPSSTATEFQRTVPYMAEAEDLPAKGFVSQRVKAFVSLSSGKAMSISAMGREAMPDYGMVSERIQAHQRFISKATTSPM